MPRSLTLALGLPFALALFACDPAKPAPSAADAAKSASTAPTQEEDPPGQTDSAETDGAPAATSAANGADAATPSTVLLADRKQSKIGFAVARATSGHIAQFKSFEARLDFAEDQPRQLEIEVKTASVLADRSGLSSHLKSSDFFDVEKFPTSTFTTERIEAKPDDGANRYEIHGTMRLHGVERKLKFPATLEITPERVLGQATLDISAKAFGINYEGMEAELAQDAVSLEIELVFPRVAAP